MTVYAKIAFVVCTVMFAVSCLALVAFVLMTAAGFWKPPTVGNTIALLVSLFLLVIFTFVFMMLAQNSKPEPTSAIAHWHEEGTVVFQARPDEKIIPNMFPRDHPQA